MLLLSSPSLLYCPLFSTTPPQFLACCHRRSAEQPLSAIRCCCHLPSCRCSASPTSAVHGKRRCCSDRAAAAASSSPPPSFTSPLPFLSKSDPNLHRFTSMLQSSGHCGVTHHHLLRSAPVAALVEFVAVVTEAGVSDPNFCTAQSRFLSRSEVQTLSDRLEILTGGRRLVELHSDRRKLNLNG